MSKKEKTFYDDAEKKLRLTIDDSSTDVYQLEVCKKCRNELNCKFMIREETRI